MHRRNATANFDIAQIVFDNTVMFAAYCLASSVYRAATGGNIFWMHSWIFLIFATVFTLSMLLMRMYNITTFYYLDRVIQRTLLSGVVAAMCLSTVIFMAKMTGTSRLLFVMHCAISVALVLSGRLVLRSQKIRSFGNGRTHILFVGDDSTRERYLHFADQTAVKLELIKSIYFDDGALETRETFARMLMDLSINEVHFACALDGGSSSRDIQPLLEVCENMGVTSRLIISPYDLPVSKRFVSSMGTYPVITYHSTSFNKLQLFFKAAIDIVGAVVGIVLLSPIFALTALAIKIESSGPVFFKQIRVGVNGKIFRIYKFRSMYADAEARKQELAALNKMKDGMMFKIDNDPRITRVGAFIRRTSIDELPQFFNVLKRDMSLVGTRPPTVDEVRRYSPEHWRRISIQPGITGMWQVNGRSGVLDFEDVVNLDKKYIDEWTLVLDIKLLLRTFRAVITRDGAV